MSRRSWNPVAYHASNGMLLGWFSFVTTLIGTDPSLALLRGAGGLTGSDASPDTGPTAPGPSFVASVTKTANVGEFLVTFADGYRFVQAVEGGLSFPVGGPADGFDVQIGEFANEGAGAETPLTVLVTVLNAARAPVESAGRRVRISIALKNSGSGS